MTCSRRSCLLFALGALIVTPAAWARGAGGEIVLRALSAFPTLEVPGFAPYYRNDARDALAIDAARHPNRFAAARTRFQGPAGLYQARLVAVAEWDGESIYRLRIGRTVVGKATNPRHDQETGREVTHELGRVRLAVGDTLQVESNAVSNGKVPEGKAFGFARGRWRALVLIPVADTK